MRAKTFPRGTSEVEMEQWRQEKLKEAGKRSEPDAPGSLPKDVEAFIAKPKTQRMRALDQCTRALGRWVDALGRNRTSLSVTKAEINAVIGDWLRTLKPGTVRKRRTWLRCFYVDLVGKGETSPVTGSDNPPNADAESRDIGYANVIRLLDAMPTYRDVKRNTPKAINETKLWCAVLAYTGIPPGVLAQLRADDLDLRNGTIRLPAREKGAGVAARTILLTDHGRVAFLAFHAANLWGTRDPRHAAGPLNVSFKRAVKRIGLVGGFHLYDLRHTFGAELYRTSRDLATVARFLGHAEGSPITARYAKGAHGDVDRAAAKAMSAALVARRRGMVKAVPSTRAVTKAVRKAVPQRQRA